jgi:hypothetical protein
MVDRLPESHSRSEDMSSDKTSRVFRFVILAFLFTCLELAVPQAQSTSSNSQPVPAPASQKTVTHKTSPYRPDPFSGRAGKYYSLVWGVDSLKVKAAESGTLIRFSYEVLDPIKAAQLADKKNEPKLIAPSARAVLVVPSLEKVGQLRQSSTPEAGKSYWMAFSNPRRTVKPGDRVDIVIGQFHAQGLLVE